MIKWSAYLETVRLQIDFIEKWPASDLSREKSNWLSIRNLP